MSSAADNIVPAAQANANPKGRKSPVNLMQDLDERSGGGDEGGKGMRPVGLRMASQQEKL
jgi:hypothetical protein